jgi:uncharacterized surface protein with fasciclin (FAS1) repeats
VPDVVETLSTTQNVTLLAPSDIAFAASMARNLRSAELTRNPRALTDLLQYHVLQGRFRTTDFFLKPKFVSTLLTTPFVNVTGGQRAGLVMVNDTAKVFSGYKQLASVVTAVSTILITEQVRGLMRLEANSRERISNSANPTSYTLSTQSSPYQRHRAKPPSTQA